ncbi:poly [ADP-ribose] polymerase 1-like isoform X2 [Patiria miniata]|uniref:PARP-type domain-containing protein n=1 Tax=Patiria miniata TaxID=46514 RepID=A0A913YWU8_PATMI|nr:poly [ADP-ribose] polymerase 1-like isoform X2 [Patiria miniata]
MAESELPFAAKYAKHNSYTCRAHDCWGGTVYKDDLCMSVTAQYPLGGVGPNWYHFDCFWKVVEGEVKSTDDIANFDDLRLDDQEKIRGCISTGGTTKNKVTFLRAFNVEYARSNRSSCRVCCKKIDKDKVRVGFNWYGITPGGEPCSNVLWYHPDCFLVPGVLAEVGWKDAYSVEMILGFEQLQPKDRKTLTEKFQAKQKAKESVGEPDATKSPKESTRKKKSSSKRKAKKSIDEPNAKKTKAVDEEKE